jgi:2-(1,2-epoxy-1,2-dihydrophenyl)acetyl-CoA isomerase
MNLARELASGPTLSLSLIRRAYWESSDNTYEEQLHLEAVLQAEAGASEDAREGAEAFRQKRPPRFKGK